MSMTNVKLGYFFPLKASYSLIGYKNEISSTDPEKAFLILNDELNSLFSLRFIINDIIKKYFNMYTCKDYHRIVISSNEPINFKSNEWRKKDFIVNLSNMQISGTDTNNVARLELFDVASRDEGIIRKCRLLCYLNKTEDAKGYISYTEEFVLEEYQEISDIIKIISTRRIENYDYLPEYITIFEDMLSYMDQINLHPDDVDWGWGTSGHF